MTDRLKKEDFVRLHDKEELVVKGNQSVGDVPT